MAINQNFTMDLVNNQSAGEWLRIHNEVIPPEQLTLGAVLERATRNQMHLGYVNNIAVACSTIRSPEFG
jgi:hypothetical protein